MPAAATSQQVGPAQAACRAQRGRLACQGPYQGPPPSCLGTWIVEVLQPTSRPPPSPPGERCTSQESSLALLWTLGIFTLNCGPVLMGFVLDFLGPKLTGILGGLVGPVGECVHAAGRG